MLGSIYIYIVLQVGHGTLFTLISARVCLLAQPVVVVVVCACVCVCERERERERESMDWERETGGNNLRGRVIVHL